MDFLDVLGPKTSKKPIKKCNDLYVSTVIIKAARDLENHQYD